MKISKKANTIFSAVEKNYAAIFLLSGLLSFFLPLVIQYTLTTFLQSPSILEVNEQFYNAILSIHLVLFFTTLVGGIFFLFRKPKGLLIAIIQLVLFLLLICNPIYWYMYKFIFVTQTDNFIIGQYLNSKVGSLPGVKSVKALTFMPDEPDLRDNTYELQIKMEDGSLIGMQNSHFKSLFAGGTQPMLWVGQLGKYQFCTFNPKQTSPQCWHTEITAPDIKKRFPFEIRTVIDIVNRYKEIEAEVSTWPRDPNHNDPNFMTYKGSNFGMIMENNSNEDSETRLFVKETTRN